MNTFLFIVGILFIASFVLLAIVYSKLYNNFRRISRERNEFLERFMGSHYSRCKLLRTMNDDYTNFVTILNETEEFVDDADLKIEIGKLKNQLNQIQKNVLAKDLKESEEFMTEYEIHQITHG